MSKQKLNEEQLEPLILNEDTKSIYSNYYICTRGITNNRTPSYNEKKYEFIIDNLPPYLMVPEITLSKLKAYMLKKVIPFVRIAQVPGYASATTRAYSCGIKKRIYL